MFKEKIKNDKKFRAQFISVIALGVVVLACAITIPICVHNSNVEKALATTQVETTTEQPSTTEEVSTTEQETTTVAETTVLAETETTEKITEKTTKKPSSGNKTGNGASNGGGSSGGSKGSGGSNSNSGGSGSGGSGNQNNVPEQTTVDPDYDWMQADVDRVVAEAKAYARSKGYKVYEDSKITVTVDGVVYETSWGNPVKTWLDRKSKALGALKYQIDRVNENNSNLPFIHGEKGVGVNVFSQRCEGDIYSSWQPYWEIYVVY